MTPIEGGVVKISVSRNKREGWYAGKFPEFANEFKKNFGLFDMPIFYSRHSRTRVFWHRVFNRDK